MRMLIAFRTEMTRTYPNGGGYLSGYEVSSKGDRRFSALYARLRDGRTIEEAYQLDVKGYRAIGNDWKLGKGKPPLTQLSLDQSYQEYLSLWEQWSLENPKLFSELVGIVKSGRVLVDSFARTPVNQARALTELVNRVLALNSLPDKVLAYVDGSFREGKVYWAFVITQDGKPIHSNCGETAKFTEMRNVAGELSATMRTAKWLKDHSLVGTICYDYEGIEKWVTGQWRCKTPGTLLYKEFISPYYEKKIVLFNKIDRTENLADALIHKAFGF